MLTIKRPSIISNRLVIAAVVFGIGFVGSLSTLSMFHRGVGQLSSGRQGTTVSETSTTGTDNADGKSGSSTDKTKSNAKDSSSNQVKPVSSAAIGAPASGFSAKSSPATQATGSAQIGGNVVPSSNPVTTVPGTTPISIPQPGTGSTGQIPTAPTSSPTSPINSLTQPVTDKATQTLPSICLCNSF